jgi:hypothetical protein
LPKSIARSDGAEYLHCDGGWRREVAAYRAERRRQIQKQIPLCASRSRSRGRERDAKRPACFDRNDSLGGEWAGKDAGATETAKGEDKIKSRFIAKRDGEEYQAARADTFAGANVKKRRRLASLGMTVGGRGLRGDRAPFFVIRSGGRRWGRCAWRGGRGGSWRGWRRR